MGSREASDENNTEARPRAYRDSTTYTDDTYATTTKHAVDALAGKVQRGNPTSKAPTLADSAVHTVYKVADSAATTFVANI